MAEWNKIVAESMTEKKPATLEEAIEIIKSHIPANSLEMWAQNSEYEAIVDQHLFGLGLTIRNKWIHGEGSPLYTKIRSMTFGLEREVYPA